MLKKYAVVLAGLVFTVACSQTDAGITTKVKTKMAADTTVKAYEINVDTKNHVVTLSGDVDTSAAKEQAIQIARGTEGVTDVIDQIHVKETAATGGLIEESKEQGREAANKVEGAAKSAGNAVEGAAKSTGNAVKDAAITTAVKAKFIADSSVKGLRIDVDTDNGVVTLTGAASSRAEADRAVVLARNTDGVVRVVDNMHIGTR
jgi:osmotically-inducible protein OsmY